MSLGASLDDLVLRAVNLAIANDVPRWEKLLREEGLTPLSAERRRSLRQSGVPSMTGITPVELRMVLETIRSRIAQEPGASALEMELSTLVDREMRRYIAHTQPPAAGLGAIFGNAHRTAVRFGPVADGVEALRCGCCGAARPGDSDLRTCAFCGNALIPARRA